MLELTLELCISVEGRIQCTVVECDDPDSCCPLPYRDVKQKNVMCVFDACMAGAPLEDLEQSIS